ncbi:MAG: alcohol dehydrogenase catalytic domain-containing protein [Anaerolineales bacterium]|jgi:L-iditol 2-dehydrogenase
MKAIRLHAPNDLRLQEESVPEPGPGEALVRVDVVGICGSDLHWFSEAGIGDAKLNRPLVLGHEFAGVIASGPRLGERVAVDPAIPCHTCEFCRQGNPNLCEHLRFAGHGMEDGALREFIVWPEECLFRLPEALSQADGAMLEPLGVAIHAVDLAHLRTGMTVGVFGCGPIGLLTIQMAQMAGANRVFATEPLPHRMQAALRLGAQDWLPAQAVDVAFEVAGNNDALETAFSAVKPGGKVILAGIPADDQSTFTASVARRKGLTIKMVRRMKFTYPRAIQLVERGQVDVRSLVTKRFPLEQAQQAFILAQKREGLKIVIDI